MHKGKAGEFYNVGADNELANIDLAKRILGILGKPKTLLTSVKDRPGHDRRYAIESAKIRDSLGWAPGKDFDSQLASTIDWYKALATRGL